MSVRYFAITTRGLEDVAQAEIEQQLPGVRIVERAYRRVIFEHHGAPARLLGLRTVDDVFVAAGALDDLVPQRAALSALRAWLAGAQWAAAAAVCAQVRRLAQPPRAAVSANAVGRRNYSAAEIKALAAAELAAQHGWEE